MCVISAVEVDSDDRDDFIHAEVIMSGAASMRHTEAVVAIRVQASFRRAEDACDFSLGFAFSHTVYWSRGRGKGSLGSQPAAPLNVVVVAIRVQASFRRAEDALRHPCIVR